MISRTSRSSVAYPLVAAMLAAGVTAVFNPLHSGVAAPSKVQAKNVIFIVGDGMAAAHREAVRLSLVGLNGQLVMDKLPVSGQLTTSPDDPSSPITDSAAGDGLVHW